MTYEHEADDEFPLFVLVDDALEKQRGMPGGIPIINPPGMKPLFAIFTDEDLAKRFCEDLRRSSDVHPRAIQSPQDMLGIAEFLQKMGIEKVARDLCFHPLKMETMSIATFIANLRRAI